MDLIKAQGRQVVPAVKKSREDQEPGADPLIQFDPNYPTEIPVVQNIPGAIQALYVWLNKTIRCTMFEQHRAYLKCPVCSEYGLCTQITRQQRIELETSPFFSIKEITWEGPRRIKVMYIAVCTDGSLRRLDDFDPKNTDGVDVDQYKDVEEVLVVTKAFRRKVMWAPVSLEQVKSTRDNGNGGSIKESDKPMKKEGIDALPKQQNAKETAKPAKVQKNNKIDSG
jgi:hypothetical protein